MFRSFRFVLLGAAGLFAAVFLAGLPVNRGVTESPALKALVTAVGSSLAFEPRLTGGFEPPLDGPLRGSDTDVELSPDVRIAIAEIEKRALADPSVDTLSLLGVALLVHGDIDRAIATLEDAAAEAKRASVWSDLSAAYLVKANRQPARRVEYLARALEAAVRSLRLSSSNEARFNYALAMNGLAPLVGTADPWGDYVRGERDPRWIERAASLKQQAPRFEDARDEWPSRKLALRAALDQRQDDAVLETVRRFPEASFEMLDQELLVEWANGNPTALDSAHRLAEAFLSGTGDRGPLEAVFAIRKSGRALAAAHIAYAAALKAIAADEYARARTHLGTALAAFRSAQSPYEESAQAQFASIDFNERRLEDALARVDALISHAERLGHLTVRARALSLRGLILSKQWRLNEALAALRAAATSFEELGQYENAVGAYGNLADTLRSIGDRHESWEFIGRTLEGTKRVRTPLRRYLICFNASLFARSDELLEAALLFQDAAVGEAGLRSGQGTSIEALVHRGLLYSRRGEYPKARDDLRAAQMMIEQQPNGYLKNGEQAEANLLAADLSERERTTPPIAQLRTALEFFERAEPSAVPRLHLSLARAELAIHNIDDADAVFARGIAQLETRQARLDDDALRISFFDEAWDLFPEMVALQLTVRRNPAKAFEFAERSRARALLAGAQPIGIDAVQRAITPGTAMLYYVVLEDRLVMWSITLSSVKMTETRFDRNELARTIGRYRADLRERRDARSASAMLHRTLIGPVQGTLQGVRTLVIVPDGALHTLPFATLRASDSGRYLVEDFAIMMAPSASLYAFHQRSSASTNTPSALLIGNPGAPGDASGLPGAESEVTAAAAFYQHPTVVTATSGTKERFLADAPKYDVVHFGGHAVPNVEYPMLSRLLFGRAGEQSQSLFAYEVARMKFTRTDVVVLAACSTAVGAMARGEGVISVARPFLAAGVPVVIASQWDVDDRPTQQLFVAFHRAYAQSHDSVRALRMAQLELLQRGDRVLSSPASWGSFIALGNASE